MISYQKRGYEKKAFLFVNLVIALVTLALTPSVAPAQSVEGRIVDQQSEEPLTGVNILVEENGIRCQTGRDVRRISILHHPRIF